MNLSPMRYKSYVWEFNPKVYEVTYKRHIVSLKLPRGGGVMQDMGKSFKVFSGEGEFTGEGAYDKFRELSKVFEEGGSGTLVHPVWQLTKAYFVSLTLRQEPRENYVAYSFEFWEDFSESTAFEKVSANIVPGGVASGSIIGGGDSSTYTVVKGDTLWGIASKYGTTAAELVSKNPQIKNPNLIYPGDVIRL
ncbi:MAG: LysM peptidoglycan-binding domain-containing protein [Oscillospiraceae bacterium]|nr:LysM peptidoglycan-binding domain-containing protein [Oscillospiraceae bacterium]